MSVEETIQGDAELFNLIDRQYFPEDTGSQSIEFTDLTGNDTFMYKLRYHLYIHPDGSNRNIKIQFNNDTATHYSGGESYYGSTTGGTTFSAGGGKIARTFSNINCRINGIGYIYPQVTDDGDYRGYKTEFLLESSTTQQYEVKMFGHWQNTADEITTITIYSTDGTGSGYWLSNSWVELFKLAPMI